MNIQVVAGKAAPNPPLWPMLGSNGVNIWQFISDFNAKTLEQMKQFAPADVRMKTKLILYADRSFDIEVLGPVTADLILWKANKTSGSGEPNKKKIAKLTKKDLQEIAELKKWDVNTDNIESIMKAVEGTAKNMGISVE